MKMPGPDTVSIAIIAGYEPLTFPIKADPFSALGIEAVDKRPPNLATLPVAGLSGLDTDI